MTFVKLAAVTAALLCGVSACTAEDKKVTSALEFQMKDIDGKEVDLSKYKGKVVLFVNVASMCGFTKQYEGMQALYSKFEKDGFVLIGVPSNDFGEQEKGTDAQIKEFCTTNYKVTFPMLAKVAVKGDAQVPLYKHLTSKETNPKHGGEVAWNFEKFLINRKGEVVGRYKSGIEPMSDELIKAVKTELDAK
ncbi:MAG TPA: glutathione peroxidase [Gemmataceae bacterium]|nr:glutathione peroxidase [Gemmataceae bacterium]